jgi:hypothetical protein
LGTTSAKERRVDLNLKKTPWPLRSLFYVRQVLLHLDPVINLAPTPILGRKLQDPLMLRITCHRARQYYAFIIHAGLHINAIENWVIAEQVLDGTLNSLISICLGLVLGIVLRW